jgi:hypothetical protein
MKNLRNLMTAVTLMAMLVIGTVSANAGIIVAGRGECTDTKTETTVDWGIIVAGFTGIIVAGFTGIIVAGKADTGCQDQSRGGILLAD